MNEKQKQDIYATANTMLKKRMKAFPDFKNYLYALFGFALSNQSETSFNAWQESVNKILKAPNKFFTYYISSCNNLFSGNFLFHRFIYLFSCVCILFKTLFFF